MLDQAKTWPQLLQTFTGNTADGREVWVGNLGRAGFDTRDHVALMTKVVSQYDVDAVVMLVGGNDLVHRLMQAESYDPDFLQDSVRYNNWLRTRFVWSPVTMVSDVAPYYQRLAIWQLLHWARSLVVQKDQIAMDSEGRWLAHERQRRREAPLVNDLPSLESGLLEYERNIRTIAAEAKKRSLRLILLTQPTMWKPVMSEQERDMIWMGNGKGKWYTTAALELAMGSYNQRLIATCEGLGLECFDLASRVPRTLDVFFDDMHFTETGAEAVATELAAYLKSRRPFTASPE